MVLLSGKELAEELKSSLAKKIVDEGLKLSIAVIHIGNDPASEKYIEIKKRESEKIGIEFKLYCFSKKTNPKEVAQKIYELNQDKKITGIIIQLPLPEDFIPNELLEIIAPSKDVDGLTSINLGKLIKDLPGIYPATAEGVIKLFEKYKIELSGKKVCVIGQSNLVGKPLAQLLLNHKATVLIVNSRTPNLKENTLESDIIISAAGVPKLITADMIKQGAVVVDIGTTLINGKIVGDVDFKNVSKKASYITPNPGGVGPMTVAMLLSNVLKVNEFQRKGLYGQRSF